MLYNQVISPDVALCHACLDVRFPHALRKIRG